MKLTPDMPDAIGQNAGGGENARRLYVFNGGFLTQKRIRRILKLAGWDISVGKPGPDDWVGVWGKSPTAPRGEAVSSHTDATILRVEDSFLRSVLPGRSGQPPIGLNLDRRGVHFDSSAPSDLEHLLATHPLDDTALLNRARDAANRLASAHLSKYNCFTADAPVPQAPYVLVIDQTRDDASIKHAGANAASFREMLVFAQTDHPSSRIIIKSHPETMAGHRDGHFGPDDQNHRITVLTDPVSPWTLMAGAIAVYTVSSQLGFEAIFAGHRPRVFGQPFYAGWGLTEDENPVARRHRKLTRAQLFAAAMILYPTWYDPNRDRLCTLEDAISALEAETRAWREDHTGYLACGISRWKYKHMQVFFGATTPIRFEKSIAGLAAAPDQSAGKLMVWGSGEAGQPVIRVEDGFLRSRGLGAELYPPLSLVADDLGIYYDPTGESRLERLIRQSTDLPQPEIYRAERLIRQLIKTGVNKYNLDKPLPGALPDGQRILVPGQVEDDASILLGCTDISSNLDLLARCRADNPNAVILYKPHPDIEAGRRPGRIDPRLAHEHADMVLDNTDPVALIGAVDQVWTMTSLLGFEALLRGVPVTCLGLPFYAGWGLTTDLGAEKPRRSARPTLAQLVHATLIGYPRYFDPLSQLPCPVEVVIERLASGEFYKSTPLNRVLAKLQSLWVRR